MTRIKLLVSQVPELWELIKFVVTKVDEVDEKNLQPYLNELLQALLNGKAQCFLGLDDERAVVTVFITRLLINKVTGEKYLFVQNMYSFRVADDETRKQDCDFLKEFAQKEQCVYVSFMSRNKRIWALAEMYGCKESFRTFDLRLEGKK